MSHVPWCANRPSRPLEERIIPQPVSESQVTAGVLCPLSSRVAGWSILAVGAVTLKSKSFAEFSIVLKFSSIGCLKLSLSYCRVSTG